MAIQETGLGWYADSVWLSDVASAIGTLTSGSPAPQIYDWSNQPIPVSSDLSRENILQNGFQYGWGDNNAVLKVMSKISGVYVFTDGAATWFVCDDPDVEISLGDIVAASSESEITSTPNIIETVTVNRIAYSVAYPLFFDVTTWIAPECRNTGVAVADALGLAENAFTPIPTLSALTVSDIINNGLAYTSDDSYSNYIGTTRSDMVVYRTFPGTIYAFCTTPNSNLSTSDVAVAQTGYGYTRSLSLSSVTYNNDVYYYLYGRPFTSGISDDGIPIIPYNPTEVAELIAGGVTPGVTISFAKSTSGYSVVCMCKWKSELGGDVYCSPFLISSVQNNTLYTRNSATPSVSTTEHTFSGMTFYMRKAPLDVLDGAETVTSNFPILDYSSGVPLTNDMLFALIANASSLGVGYPPQEEDPYGPGGNSGPGGGDPNFDDSSDTIDDSSLPTFSFAATGFTRIYNPDLTELNDLARYLWTDQTFLQTVINHLKQLLENPMDAVISLSRVPVPVPQGTSEEVKVMYIPTGVYMPPATTQFVDVDCGSLLIDKRYDSALDFNPYTKVSLFLPFVGMVNLDTDEVMGQTIFVKYRVDIVSGACVAKVFVGSTEDKSCLYQYSGDCSMAMPINSADFSGYKAAVISAAKVVSLGVAAAGSGIAAAASAEGFKTAVSGGAELTFTEEQKSQYDKAMSNISSTIKNSPEKASFEDSAKKQASNTVGSVVGSKVEVEHSGGFSGNTGVLGIRRPYVVIKRPRMCNPQQYGKYNGRPCQMYLNLGTLSGYTEIQSIQLTGFSATNPELAEIANLLKGGVIL